MWVAADHRRKVLEELCGYFGIVGVLEGEERRVCDADFEQWWIGLAAICDDVLEDGAGSGAFAPKGNVIRI